MLLFKGYISNFACARYYFLYLEFSEFYINQSLAGQTIPIYQSMKPFKSLEIKCCHGVFQLIFQFNCFVNSNRNYDPIVIKCRHLIFINDLSSVNVSILSTFLFWRCFSIFFLNTLQLFVIKLQKVKRYFVLSFSLSTP
jgi:hypothetical protein